MPSTGSENRQRVLLLIAIVLLGFAFRYTALSSIPAGFFRDEADKGYTTWCLMTLGTDQTGARWPVFVQALKVTTSSLYQYLDIPIVALFGLTEFAVRLPACLAGTLSVFAAWLFARRFWGANAALWAALFVALSPWSILLSRWANQSILLTAWMPLAVFFLFRRDDAPSKKDAIFSAFFFLLALYTYATARLTVPLLCLLFSGVMIFCSKNRLRLLPPLAVFWTLLAVGALPLLQHLLLQPEQSGARLSNISIFDGQPLLSLIREFLWNYLLHLSPVFLFVSGDANPRHNAMIFGQLHWYIAPLLLAGLFQCVRKRSRIDIMLLAWFFCFPIAAACTRESIPHALRSIYAVPVVHLLAAYGLIALIENRAWFESRLSPGAVRAAALFWIACLVFLPLMYGLQLFVRYPVLSAPAWEYGYRDAIQWREQNAPGARTLVSGIAEYPEVFFLFYGKFPPARWISNHRIDNIEFLPLGVGVDSRYSYEGPPVLYLARPGELAHVQPEKSILLPSGEPIWKWVRGGRL